MHPIWNHYRGKRGSVSFSLVWGALGGQALQTLWERMTWMSPEKCLCETQGHSDSLPKTNYCEYIKKERVIWIKRKSPWSQSSGQLMGFPIPLQSLNLNLTKPSKIKQKCSCCPLSSLRLFIWWLLFPSFQNEESCWYFGWKLANIMFWQNPPMAGKSVSILI